MSDGGGAVGKEEKQEADRESGGWAGDGQRRP